METSIIKNTIELETDFAETPVLYEGVITIIKIPRIMEPDEDELFASWIIRLAGENVISNTRSFIKAYIYPNEPNRRYILTRMDHRIPFELFWRSLEFIHDDISESDLFIRTTTFTGTSPFMRKEQRQRYLNQAFYLDKKMEPLFAIPHGTVDGLYLCPECATEEVKEKGYFTLHRAHHLPGVTVCHKHGCALGKIEESYINIKPDRIPSYIALDVHNTLLAQRYAVFAKEFMDEEVDCSQEEMVSLIFERKTNRTELQMEREGYLSIVEKLETLFAIQLHGPYISPVSAMATLMHLFGADAEAAAKALKEKNDPSIRKKLLQKVENEGYSLFGSYRNDIVTLRHDLCGETFCTSPYGFLAGWRCPSCSKVTLQEQYEELVRNIGQGDYTPLDAFEGMDKKVSLLHIKCGKKMTTKARAFLNEGVRCECRYRVDFDAAKAEIEKNDGFTLVEYTRTDKPVRIRHSCGGEFSIYYMKFLESPRCRVCQRQGHLQIRTTDDLIKDISDLTGEDYTLIDTYEGARVPVRIRHNVCGNIQEYLPHRFLDGQRCRICGNDLTDQEFAEYVAKFSLGRYEMTGCPTKNLYRIHDNETGSNTDLPKAKVLQELARPTPSLLLPLERRDRSVSLRSERKGEAFLSYLAGNFGNGLIFAEDIQYEPLQGDDLYTALSNLVKGNHLRHLAAGIYTTSDREYSDEELITARYIERYGHRIGFLRGGSYAYMLGIADRPAAWGIASNKESFKTPPRKTKFLGKDIHIKGMPVEITDENYLILETVDFLVQYRQYTDMPAEEVVAAVRHHLRIENNGDLPDRMLFDDLISKYRAVNIRTMMSRRIDLLYAKEGEDQDAKY